jgi:cell division protein FtsZ
LIGVGGAGCAIARGINRAFGDEVRHLLVDTDARSGEAGGPFTLLGGDRLSGRGAGGDIVAGRMAAEDSVEKLDAQLEDVRLAVVVTSLGGGTGGGATLETVKHLRARGIPSCVFATLPFAFEGEERERNARAVTSMIAETANASFFIPLDKLVGENDKMDEALRHAVDTLASGITLFWRLVEKPGYIKLDAERVRLLISKSGHGRFATVTVQGPSRAADAVDALARANLLTAGSGSVSSILCGVLAGEDLRLSEIGRIADGVRAAFGEKAAFELATVNDEETFAGRLSVVLMLFEAGGAAETGSDETEMPRRRRRHKARPTGLDAAPFGRGRFNNAVATIWNGEDLDVPTYIRKNINLDY